MRIERVRVKRAAAGKDAVAWKRALEDSAWLAEAKVLKDEPGSSWVRRAELNGRDVVVKCRLLNTFSRRVKAGVGMGHGAKQWRGAERLTRAGIATARPVMSGRAVVDGLPCDVLVLEHVAGPTVLEVLAKIAAGDGPSVREQHEMAAAVGLGLRRFIMKLIYNRDFKPSNLIVRRCLDGTAEIVVVDTVGLKRMNSRHKHAIKNMPASLMLEPLGCGCAPRSALWMRVMSSALMDSRRGPAGRQRGRVERWFLHKSVRSVRRVVLAHGDARSKINPLARVHELHDGR